MNRQARLDRKRLSRETRRLDLRRASAELDARVKARREALAAAAKVSPAPTDVKNLMRAQLGLFKARFGRHPAPGEPLFFDPRELVEMGPVALPADAEDELVDSLAEFLEASPDLLRSLVRSGIVVRSVRSKEQA